ncbi:transposase [Nitrosomonas cryotolerans]|uniref:transposase n=1 Tax=Nitrosomonas cryotolerans TaxID=44575 RepID=UPI00048B6860
MSSDLGREGYGIVRLFYGLLLQFMEDLSDRECERFLKEKLSGKWLCGFRLRRPLHNCMKVFQIELSGQSQQQLMAEFNHLKAFSDVYFLAWPNYGHRDIF